MHMFLFICICLFSYVYVSFHTYMSLFKCICLFSNVEVSFDMYVSLFIHKGLFSCTYVSFHMYLSLFTYMYLFTSVLYLWYDWCAGPSWRLQNAQKLRCGATSQVSRALFRYIFLFSNMQGSFHIFISLFTCTGVCSGALRSHIASQ